MKDGFGGLMGSDDLTSLSSMKIPLSSLSSSSPLPKKEWISSPAMPASSAPFSADRSFKYSYAAMSLRKRFALTLFGWQIFLSLMHKARIFYTNRF